MDRRRESAESNFRDQRVNQPTQAPQTTHGIPRVPSHGPGAPPTHRIVIRDPTIPASIPPTPREKIILPEQKQSTCKSGANNFFNFIYNRHERTFCERTCQSWFMIIGYSIMYLIFLSTYTMIFLYGSLAIIKATENFGSPIEAKMSDSPIFVRNGVGLSATPTSSDSNGKPLIWYRSSEQSDYQKYISAIGELLNSRNMTPELINSLGPCGRPPYGYGSKPCVIVRINKQLNWSGKPLSLNSTLIRIAPEEVQKWVKSGKKMLWLHCEGYDDYDREHIGIIDYHPYPPGFDPDVYPLDVNEDSPLVAVQFSEFTQGVSLSVSCKLWYEFGPSAVHFTLYVAPANKMRNGSTGTSM